MNEVTAVLRALVPVVLMMGLGYVLRRTRMFSDQGISELKFLVTKVILPAAIFHALATAEYTSRSWVLVGIMLVMMITPLLGGPEARPFCTLRGLVRSIGILPRTTWLIPRNESNLSFTDLSNLSVSVLGFSVGGSRTGCNWHKLLPFPKLSCRYAVLGSVRVNYLPRPTS